LTFGTTGYYYNSRNRLERVTLPDGRIATYTYDPFTYIACNDDACGSGVQSQISGLYLQSDDEILIVVDGYGGDFGDYELDIIRATGEDESDPITIQSLPGQTGTFRNQGRLVA